MEVVLLVAANPSDETTPRRQDSAQAVGRCNDFLKEDEVCRIARTAAVRKRRRGSDQDRKAARAESLVMVGELSSARQVLESADLASGNLSTLRALTDPEKRPPLPRDPPPSGVVGPDARQSVPVGRRQVGSEHQESTSGSGTWAFRHDERTFVHAAGV